MAVDEAILDHAKAGLVPALAGADAAPLWATEGRAAADLDDDDDDDDDCVCDFRGAAHARSLGGLGPFVAEAEWLLGRAGVAAKDD